MKFSQMTNKIGTRFKQRIVPIINGVYAKLRMAIGNPIVINDASDEVLSGLRIFGKSTQNGTPSPATPVEIVSVENPMAMISSKNLIPFPYPMLNVYGTGITATAQEDGGVLLNGTASNGDVYVNLCQINFGIGQTAHYSTHGFIANKYNDNVYVTYDQGNHYTFIVVKGGTVCNNILIYPQLEAGFVPTEYEKGKSTQPLLIPYTLHGIPVTSGGNYTDANGQQWICDEVDFERGLYIQRTKLIDLKSIEAWDTWGVNNQTQGNTGFYSYLEELGASTSNIFCTIAKWTRYAWGGREVGANISTDGRQYMAIALSNNVLSDVSTDELAIQSFKELLVKTDAKMLVNIDTIETPLTAAQIEAYKLLHTNKPNTTISNDQNAWIEVKYISK